MSFRGCSLRQVPIVSLADDGFVKVWDARSGVERQSLGARSYGGNKCAASGDGLTVAAAVGYGVHVWHLQ